MLPPPGYRPPLLYPPSLVPPPYSVPPRFIPPQVSKPLSEHEFYREKNRLLKNKYVQCTKNGTGILFTQVKLTF